MLLSASILRASIDNLPKLCQSENSTNTKKVEILMVKLGSFISWLLIGFGALRVAIGFFVAAYFVDEAAMRIAAQRYLGTSTGDAIDTGLLVLIAGVALGLLVRIAKRRG